MSNYNCLINCSRFFFFDFLVPAKFLLQVAGLPTNINFLQKLANHWAFENGNVETHFIEHFKDELFPDSNNSMVAKEMLDAAKFSAMLIAACVSEKELSASKKNLSGN